MKTKFLLLSILFLNLGFADPQKSRFEELELFNKVLFLIEKQYYRKVDTNKLIEGALKGMMDTLDPHSAFLNKDTFKKMQNDTKGEFGGLGIEVTEKDGQVYVVTPIDDTPAFRAGIRPKDKIVEINHESILGLTLNQSVEKMKGKNGSKIHLGILREGTKDIIHFDIKREIIKVRAVKSKLIDKYYAYLRLTQFQKNAASSLINEIKKLEKKSKSGLRGIVLDLRSNPGGLLDQAVDVSSIFLKDGVVVSTEARDPNNKEIRYVKKSGYKKLNLPLAVLVNGASASASEIVAGAIQDHKRGIIVGSRTFGKGSVQTVAQVDESNGVKLTIAQYMTPKGRKIQAVGIKPDIELVDIALDDFENSVIEDNYIREKDLRNHLTATIETAEEKKERLKLEKADRLKRAAYLKNRNENRDKKKKADDIFRRFSPETDFQVGQAIGFLKARSL